MAAIDDGWAVPPDTTESLLRLLPDADAFPSAAEEEDLDASELDCGWSLAEGTVEHGQPVRAATDVMPMAFCPAPLQTIAPEQQEEFSKPDLALGTDVDLPPPSGAWFAELTAVVPKSFPRAATRPATAPSQQLNLKSCFSDVEDAFFASGDEIELDHQQALAQAAPAPLKKRWWQRRK